MPVWEAPPIPAGWAVRAAPALVGRERELHALEHAWQVTLDGDRQVVFVGGEPGAGKSRLAAEVVATLHAEGAAVLVGTCIPDLGGPYEPFVAPVDVLHRALVDDPAGLGVGGHDARVISDRVSALLGRTPDGVRTTYQREVYDAVVDLVVAAASRRPVVLVMEDLHLAGPATLQLLGYLVERSAGSRLLVVVTHRTTHADRSPDLVRAISSLYARDGVRRLDLAGLDTEAIGQYLVLEGGLRRDRVGPLATLLRDATGGNPFFLRETWRDLSAEGGLAALRSGCFPVPQSVLHTLQGRLERLDATHRQAVEIAAVLGVELDVATVSEVAGSTPQQSLEAVDRAVELGLMAASAGTDGSWHFVHSLARQAVLDLMPASRLTSTHAAVARVLGRRRPQTDVLVQRLAHHYDRASALGLADEAVEYLVRAATLAQETLAHREAASLLERAAVLSGDPDRQDDLRLAAARSNMLGADFSRSGHLYEQVATRAGGSRRMLGAIGYEVTGWREGVAGDRAAQLLADQLHARPVDPGDPTFVRALAGLGRALAYTGDSSGEVFCEQALGYARALGDDELTRDALEARMGYGHTPTAARARLELAEELAALSERTGAIQQVAAAAYNRAVLGYVLGDPDRVRTARSDLFRAARLTGQPAWTHAAQTLTFGGH